LSGLLFIELIAHYYADIYDTDKRGLSLLDKNKQAKFYTLFIIFMVLNNIVIMSLFICYMLPLSGWL
jgi:hypothetical protein